MDYTDMSRPDDPMADPVPVQGDREILYYLRAGLSQVPRVDSAYFLHTDKALSVWVGIADDDPVARHAVYTLDDEISEQFSWVIFDFHVVPVPPGRKMEEFVSAAELIV